VDDAYQRHQAADFAALRTHELSSLLRPFLILLRIVHHIHRMPRTENVSFSFSKGSNVTRVGSLCHTGAGHSESGTSSPSASPSAFFRIGLRRPNCATIANNFLPSSETPHYAT